MCLRVETDPADLRQSVEQSVEKIRRKLSQVTQCGRVMSINLVFDGWKISSSAKAGYVPSISMCLGRGFSMIPTCPRSG